MNKPQIEAGVALILRGLEVDLNDHNFTETPQRVAKAYSEMFAQPSEANTTFPEEYADFILIRRHEMWTLCPHHLLPVRMLVSVAYIPTGTVLGLSKVVRIMQRANKGPIMQERFTYLVKEGLYQALEEDVDGICVQVEGVHDCMRIRGVRSCADTITMATYGHFEDDDRMLDRFLALVGRR